MSIGDSEPKFSLDFPSPTAPTLPEYFKKTTLDGLIPGEMVFPYSYSVKYDLTTGLLYIATKTQLDSEAITLPSYATALTGRATIMRLLETLDNGELIDGYIADLRHIKPGDINSCTVHLPENASTFDTKIAQDTLEREGLKPPLAIVFNDPDGNPHYMGDERLHLHVEQMMKRGDQIIAERTHSSPAAVAVAAATESTALDSSAMSLGPENYLG